MSLGVNTLVGFVMFVKHAQEYLLQKFLLHSVAFWRKDSPKLENTWGEWKHDLVLGLSL